MKERILVTGGTGYIGSHTVVELQNSGYEVIIIDNLSNSSADVVDNIEKVSGIRPAFEKLDCLDFAGLDAVFAKYKGIKAITAKRNRGRKGSSSGSNAEWIKSSRCSTVISCKTRL